MAEEKGNEPVAREKAGLVQVATWENKGTTKEGKDYSMRSHKITRGYKDKDDKWQNTDNFPTQDIPRVIACLQKVYNREVFKTEEEITEE